MKNKFLGFYNYTVILTYIGFACGFLGICAAMEGSLKNAVLCLMLAGICDMFDGPIARTMERTDDQKRFGIQIDSLCDLVCFGILPGVLGYRMPSKGIIKFCVSVFYSLAALIRLAYFNVDEEHRQDETTEVREYYQGLPVTTSAGFIPLVLSLSYLLHLNPSYVILVLLTLMGFLFISPVKIKKPQKKGKIVILIMGLCTLGLVLYTIGGM